MASSSIQLISKTDFTDQALVPVAPPSAPLTASDSPDTARIRSRVLGLTTNVFTYAKLGGTGFPGLDWWNAWPMPDTSALPAPFNDDTSKYCRISAWGYSEVVESTVPGLPTGTFLYGYQPIGTAPEDLHLQPVAGVSGIWIEVSERRKGLLAIYNTYQITAASVSNDRDDRGWDALMRPLFGTSWMLNNFVFDPTGTRTIHPLGMDLPWMHEDADIKGATVILLAPSGKTGLAFAQQIRRGRAEGDRPARVLAVGSGESRAFTLGTGLFDDVLGYDDYTSLPGVIGGGDGKPKKVVLINFGARGDAADRWADALRPACERLRIILIGSDPSATQPSTLLALAVQPGSGVTRSNAGGQRERVKLLLGVDKYEEELEAAWKAFREDGAIKGLSLVWGRGIDEFKEGWDVLAKGGNKSNVGLVYELP